MTHSEASRLPPVPRAIRNRLAWSVAALVVLVLALTIGGVAWMGLTIGAIAAEVTEVADLGEAERALYLAVVEQEDLALEYALGEDDPPQDAFQRAVDAELGAHVRIGQIAPDDAAIQEASAQVRRAASAWRVAWAAPIINEQGGREAAADPAALDLESRLYEPITEGLDRLNERTGELRSEASARLASFVGNVIALMLPVIGVIAVATVMFGASLIHVISGPLTRLNHTAHRLIAGDAVTFEAERNDEIGALAEILERLRQDAAKRYEDALVEADTAATFNQLSELISFAQDEPTLVDAATRVLQRIARSERGQVLLLNNSTNRLIVAATWGSGMPAIGSVVELDRPDRCPGIRRATAYVADDLANPLTVQCPAHSAKSGTVACLPMPALGSIVGVIHLERAEPHSFERPTVEHAARTAEQVALALANARLMKTMEGLANTDPVTGLRNARFFDAYLEQELALAQRERDSIGLIMLDLDKFKEFNDTHGHPAGDEALRALGRTLRATLRDSDVVARYGGEEFIIALHHATLADAITVAEKIRSAVEQTVVELGPGRYGRMTASLGVVATDSHRLDRKGLVSLADEALYRAKAAGRNRVEAGVAITSPPATRVKGAPVVLPIGAAGRRPRARRTRGSREQRQA